MSILKVEVVKIDEIKVHPNADALEIAIIKGWQVVVRKGDFVKNELAIYFPLDSILPERLSEAIGVTKYLSKGRVRAAVLRGEPSYGLLWKKEKGEEYLWPAPFDTRHYGEGDDLTEGFGVTKWIPPPICNSHDAETPHVLFDSYTDIQNMRTYPDVIWNGEDVIITEKIHGANARHAYVANEYMAGSHDMRLKESLQNKWWYVFNDNMKKLVKEISLKNGGNPVIMYGEIYGWIQDLHYGFKQGFFGYRCFDIKVKGKYLDYPEFIGVCNRFGIETVPILYRGKFDLSKVLQFQNSKSVIEGSDNIMEGVVVKPVHERFDGRIGRVILKYVFDQYLNRKGGTEFH